MGKDRWIIRSHVGAGPLRFGMLADEVRRSLAAPATPFFKGEEAIDAFDTLGVHVTYDDAGSCVAIELFSEADAVFAGCHLFHAPYQEVERRITSRDPAVLLQNDGFVSLHEGVAARGDPDGTGQPATSVMVFRRGYYDGAMAALEKLRRSQLAGEPTSSAGAVSLDHARPADENSSGAEEEIEEDEIEDAPGWHAIGITGESDFRVAGASEGKQIEVGVVEWGQTIVVEHDGGELLVPRSAMIALLRGHTKIGSRGDWRLHEDAENGRATLSLQDFDHTAVIDFCVGDLTVSVGVADVPRYRHADMVLPLELLAEFLARNGWTVVPPARRWTKPDGV
jgi:hypothetical protein